MALTTTRPRTTSPPGAPLWLLLVRNLTVPMAALGAAVLAAGIGGAAWLVPATVILAAAWAYRPDLVPAEPGADHRALHAAAWVVIGAALAVVLVVNPDWTAWQDGQGVLYTDDYRQLYGWVLPLGAGATLVYWVVRWADLDRTTRPFVVRRRGR
jgi:hypothetical protein